MSDEGQQVVSIENRRRFSVFKNFKYAKELKKVGIEILTIVFSISISVWLFSINEDFKQQQEVKAFLLGLKEEFKRDIEEMESDKDSYVKQQRLFTYIAGLKISDSIDPNKLDPMKHRLYSRTMLVVNNSLYEGFKSSGKLGYIKEDQLLNEIINLYQEDINFLHLSSDAYINGKQRLYLYLEENQKRVTDSTSNINTLLKTDRVMNISERLSDVAEILSAYDVCIEKMKTITALIDEKYGMENGD